MRFEASHFDAGPSKAEEQARRKAHFLEYGMSLEVSVDAPRFDGFGPDRPFMVETRVPDNVREGLKAYGVAVASQAPHNWHFGSIHAGLRDPKTGELTGVADARRGGFAQGY